MYFKINESDGKGSLKSSEPQVLATLLLKALLSLKIKEKFSRCTSLNIIYFFGVGWLPFQTEHQSSYIHVKIFLKHYSLSTTLSIMMNAHTYKHVFSEIWFLRSERWVQSYGQQQAENIWFYLFASCVEVREKNKHLLTCLVFVSQFHGPWWAHSETLGVIIGFSTVWTSNCDAWRLCVSVAKYSESFNMYMYA